jgi:hypothetical protein
MLTILEIIEKIQRILVRTPCEFGFILGDRQRSTPERPKRPALPAGQVSLKSCS